MQSSQSIIIILLVANLVATIWLGLSDRDSISSPDVTEESKHELPSLITKEIRNDLFNKFSTLFNSQDYDGLYHMFSPTARSQIPRESAYETIEKLTEYFDGIDGGGYTHSVYLGSQGDMTKYKLYYTTRLSEKSVFGTDGTLTITIAIRGNEYEVYAFRLHGDAYQIASVGLSLLRTSSPTAQTLCNI